MSERRLSGWYVSVGFRLFGYYAEICFYPFGAWRRSLLIVAGQNLLTPEWHLLGGPFHAHGFYLGWKLIAIDLNVAHDPFWGGPVAIPPRYRIIFSRASDRNPKGGDGTAPSPDESAVPKEGALTTQPSSTNQGEG